MVACTAALSWMTARRRRRGPGPGPAPAPPQLRDPPRRPGTGPRPVPVPGVRVPPDRPASHPALGQRRPHRPGQPDQLVPLAPQGGPRPRLHHRRLTTGRRSPSTARTGPRCPPAPPCASPTAASARPMMRTSPRTRSSRPGTASAWTWTTPSPSASPTPVPTRRSEPTRSRLRRPCSGRSHGAATSAPRSTTSAAITRSTRPPDSPAPCAGFAIFRLLRTELNEANEETQLGTGCTGGGRSRTTGCG